MGKMEGMEVGKILGIKVFSLIVEILDGLVESIFAVVSLSQKEKNV